MKQPPTHLHELLKLAMTADPNTREVRVDSGHSATIERDDEVPGSFHIVGHDPEGKAGDWAAMQIDGNVGKRPHFYPEEAPFLPNLNAFLSFHRSRLTMVGWQLPGDEVVERVRGFADGLKALPDQLKKNLAELGARLQATSDEERAQETRSAISELPEEHRVNLLSLWKQMTTPNDDNEILVEGFDTAVNALKDMGWTVTSASEDGPAPFGGRKTTFEQAGKVCHLALLSAFGVDQMVLQFPDSWPDADQ